MKIYFFTKGSDFVYCGYSAEGRRGLSTVYGEEGNHFFIVHKINDSEIHLSPSQEKAYSDFMKSDEQNVEFFDIGGLL